MRIIDLGPDRKEAIQQAAALLVEGFKEHWPKAWPNREAALEEAGFCYSGRDAGCEWAREA